MTEEIKILRGSYKKIPIRIESAGMEGGIRSVKKEFPNRDTQTIEVLGLKPRSYSLSIIISELGKTVNNPPREDYFTYRDRLLTAVEDKTPGVLDHPFYGTINNVIATEFSLNENFTAFGRSTLSVTFEINDDTGIPVASITALSQLENLRKKVDDVLLENITTVFSPVEKFKNNFKDAQDKINSIIDAAIDATSFIGAISSEINEFNQFVGQFSDKVNSLIVAPNNLALSISNLFGDINGLFGTAKNTAKSFIRFFEFGSDDIEIKPTTVGLVERKENRAILNEAVNVYALIYAYVATAQIQFETVLEIEEAEEELEEQYQRIINTENISEVVNATQQINQVLSEMRIVVQLFFDEERKSAQQIITIFTNETSARLLSYQYYGESNSAVEIIALNNIKENSFVSDEVNILTA